MSRTIARALPAVLRPLLIVLLLTVAAVTARVSPGRAATPLNPTFTVSAAPYVGVYPGATWTEQVTVRSAITGAPITSGIGLRLSNLPPGVTYTVGRPNIYGVYPVYLTAAYWTPYGYYYNLTVTGYVLPPLISAEQHSATFVLQIL